MESATLSIQDPINGNNYTCRRMTLEDLDQVLVLEQRSFHPPWSREAFEAELDDRPYSFSLVMKDAESIIAYMVAYFVFEEAHLANIAVAPEYQQRGLGEWLIRHLTQLAIESPCEVILLEVRKSNEKAIRLYKRLGFVESGVRKQYYEDKEDALLLCKTLKNWSDV